jgi:pyruvate, orthophosphate dikinase
MNLKHLDLVLFGSSPLGEQEPKNFRVCEKSVPWVNVETYGGKGSHLIEMSSLGLPVPAGFVIPTDFCDIYWKTVRPKESLYPWFQEKVLPLIGTLESITGKKFGSWDHPLMLSLRSGSPQSMPGMMDTLLNVGLNGSILKAMGALDWEGLGMVEKEPFGIHPSLHRPDYGDFFSHDKKTADDNDHKNHKKSLFYYEVYARLIQSYASSVAHISPKAFQEGLVSFIKETGKSQGVWGTWEWAIWIDRCEKLFKQKAHQAFPQCVETQLWQGICGVLDSWNSHRAQAYRRMHGMGFSPGTAVVVQSMVFGNGRFLSEEDGMFGQEKDKPLWATGVVFSRNPSTGAKERFGEFLENAQGEDIVSGARTPLPIEESQETSRPDGFLDLKNCGHPSTDFWPKDADDQATVTFQKKYPKIYAQLCQYLDLLESHYKDMQDVEFTIEKDKIWILQTRKGKRTAGASLRIALDMVAEGLLSPQEALSTIDVTGLDQLFYPHLVNAHDHSPIARGLAASPGGGVGIIALSCQKVLEYEKQGIASILVRSETSTEDIRGISAAVGIVTSRGGMTSHAAVVARGMGKPCVVGLESLEVDDALGTVIFHQNWQKSLAENENLPKNPLPVKESLVLKEGDSISIDGATGCVYQGFLGLESPCVFPEWDKILKWADEQGSMGVFVNADTPEDIQKALSWGAQGVGLCRTEHMFFQPEGISIIRSIILRQDCPERSKALMAMKELQKKDFIALMKAVGDLPLVIRLLDPPLHEFLPKTIQEIQKTALDCAMEESVLRNRMAEIAETNPMLGKRGVRLGIVHPEIYRLQFQAIFEAMIVLGHQGPIQIMVPFVMSVLELEAIKAMGQGVLAEMEQHLYRGGCDHPKDLLQGVPHESGGYVASGQERSGNRDLGKDWMAQPTSQPYQVTYEIGTMIELPRAALLGESLAKSADFFSFGTNDLTQTTLGLSRDDMAQVLRIYQDQGLWVKDPFVSIDQEGVGSLLRTACQQGRRGRLDLKLGVCGEHGGDPESIAFFETLGIDYVSCSLHRIIGARIAVAQAHIQKKKAQEKSL